MKDVLLWNFETTRQKIGKSKHGLRWLIRNRAIDGMVKIGSKIYFDPKDVEKWVEKNKVAKSKIRDEQ